MARSLNRVMLIGNSGQDAELKYSANGVAISTFSVATSESWKDQEGNQQERTSWHNVVAFKKLAEICGEWVKKGNKVYVEGKLQTDKYEKDGQTHYSTKIVADQLILLGGKPETTKNETTALEQRAPKDDDLPF